MQSLLATLSALQVKIEVREGKLRVNAPAGVLTPELQKEISLHRGELIERLQASSRPAAPQEQLPRIVPDPEHRHEPFPLNTVQHAYWIGRSSHVELGDVTSHVYFEFECEDLDPERLSTAFRKVVALHGMLRAVIDVNGQQRILETVPDYEIAVTDLRGADPEQRETELLRVRSELAQQVFDCGQWPQFEIRLIQIAADQSRLCASWDFLVVDAWSLSILFEQWYGFYHDPAYTVDPPLLTFRDYVLAEERLRELPSYQAAKTYWWDRIDDLPSSPLLPVVNRIERGRTHEFKRRRYRLRTQQWEEIKTRARRSGLTLSTVLLAAFAEVLNRWAKSPHYALNLTLFNRLPLHEEVNSIIGDFTNLLVLEVDGRQGDTYLERAARIQDRFLGDFEHRQVSAIEVLRELAKRRNWQQRAILPVVFTSTLMLDGKRGEDAGGWERFGPMGFGISQTPQVSLDYQVFEVYGDLVINWDAVDEVFFPGVLDDMFTAQVELLESLAMGVEAWERREPVGLPAAQRKIREAVSDTEAERFEHCLHAPFVERALERPDSMALAWSGGTMTYGELLALSHFIAEQLRERGVRPNELVAIVMRKGWEQVAAVLGVLMAGGAYLPVDARWPVLRRQQILEQGEARIALTQEALDEELEWPAQVERIRVGRKDLPRLDAAPEIRSAVTDLAYVIFTSGSTGTPKGVMIDHRGAVNTVIHMNRLFGVEAGDSVLAVSDLTFDLSVYDIFGLLAAGGTVVIPDAELSRDPGHWDGADPGLERDPLELRAAAHGRSRRGSGCRAGPRARPPAPGPVERRLDPGPASGPRPPPGAGRPGDQLGRRHRGLHLVDPLPDRPSLGGVGQHPLRQGAAEPAHVRAESPPPALSGLRDRRHLHWRDRRCARLLEGPGEDPPAVPLASGDGREAVLHRRPGAVLPRRQHRVPGPRGLAGQAARPSRGAGGDHGLPPDPSRGPRCRGPADPAGRPKRLGRLCRGRARPGGAPV
jgi:pyochelin synthetase